MIEFRPMRRLLWLLLSHLFIGFALGQTDETIFREFQFDFSTPGARANGMGRAFVGLSDEATAAFNNPAGLSILNKPEFSFEYRNTHSRFEALTDRNQFLLLDGNSQPGSSDLSRLTFASMSISKGKFNYSFFFVNQLDYRRERLDERTEWEHDVTDDNYFFVYDNQQEVRKISLDTYGVSLSRKWGKWSFGLSFGFSNLSLDYRYFTLWGSPEFSFSDRAEGGANHQSTKPTFVFGTLYQVSPKLRVAVSAKRQPIFKYDEQITNNEFPTETAIGIRFKIPDSYTFGIAYQPDEFWTLVGEVDWIQYQQLSGENFTILSDNDIGQETFFRFDRADYKNENDPEIHLGLEYLFPHGKNIFAFRAGTFSDPDHKTRFVGQPKSGESQRLYDIQEFIFNTGSTQNSWGYTVGLGYVRNNRFQLDVAVVNSDRFRRVITSFLYRF